MRESLRRHFSIDWRPRFGYYAQRISLIKDASGEGTPWRRGECGARARNDTLRTRAARASCLPALRPAREVHRCDRGGALRLSPQLHVPSREAWPEAEPSGRKSRWREPRWNAGRRARPQAEGGASRLTPWRVPHAACVRESNPASAGVPLPFIFSFLPSSLPDLIRQSMRTESPIGLADRAFRTAAQHGPPGQAQW